MFVKINFYLLIKKKRNKKRFFFVCISFYWNNWTNSSKEIFPSPLVSNDWTIALTDGSPQHVTIKSRRKLLLINIRLFESEVIYFDRTEVD